jgi:hypothetical protein
MVYRPPKKKAAPGGFPGNNPQADPLEGPLQGPTRAFDPRAGDDRHLVSVDDSFAEADYEDRIWLFWQKNRAFVLSFISLLCLGVVAWEGWVLYQKHQNEVLQQIYSEATTAPDLLTYARLHPDTKLGQLALLEAADTFYQGGNFKTAEDAYGDAATAWGYDPNGQRARLGRALALLFDGQVEACKDALKGLAGDTLVLPNYRAEANYFLAVLALQAGDRAGAQQWIDAVKAVPQAQVWARQAEDLAQLTPVFGAMAMLPTTTTAPAATGTVAPTAGAVMPTAGSVTAPSLSPDAEQTLPGIGPVKLVGAPGADENSPITMPPANPAGSTTDK